MSADLNKPEPILEDALHFDESLKPSSGVSSNTATEPLISESEVTPRWYKRPKFWGILVLVLLFVIGCVLAFLAWRNRTVSRDFYTSNWRQLVAAADKVTTDTNQTTFTNFKDVEKSLIDLQAAVEESLAAQSKQPTFLNDQQDLARYKQGTTKLLSYTKQARELSAQLKDASPDQLNDLGSSGAALKQVIDEMRKTMTILKSDLPDGFYVLNERFGTVLTAYKATQSAEQAKQDAVKSKEEQARQDQANAEEAVAVWSQAYIDGKPDAMKQVMTPAFITEYNFAQVTATSRQFNYPVSFRRVNTAKSGEQFEIQQTMSFVTKYEGSPETTYTQSFAYLVSQDPTTKRWLVNAQRFQ